MIRTGCGTVFLLALSFSLCAQTNPRVYETQEDSPPPLRTSVTKPPVLSPAHTVQAGDVLAATPSGQRAQAVQAHARMEAPAGPIDSFAAAIKVFASAVTREDATPPVFKPDGTDAYAALSLVPFELTEAEMKRWISTTSLAERAWLTERWQEQRRTMMLAKDNPIILLVVVGALAALALAAIAKMIFLFGREKAVVAVQTVEAFQAARLIETEALKHKYQHREERVAYFYPRCMEELLSYCQSLNNPDHPPAADQCIKAAINARVVYDLFKNVDGVKEEAREALSVVASETVERVCESYNLSVEDAAKLVKQIIGREYSRLSSGEESEQLLPIIKSAYLMSQLAGFDQIIS